MTHTTSGPHPPYRVVRGADLCGYKFASGIFCNATEDHPVHHGKWRGPEDNHEFNHQHRFVCECGQAMKR